MQCHNKEDIDFRNNPGGVYGVARGLKAYIVHTRWSTILIMVLK